MRVVTVVEIDLPLCQLTYSEAPCEAELGVTGEKRCFQTRKSCQDLENFDPAATTVRFIEDSADLAYDALPNLVSVRTRPGVTDPGRSMGQRESVTVTFRDHPHSDAGPILFDKYIADRSYDPFEQGTFWGKFRARHTSLKGVALRIKRGELGDALDDMDTYHYVIESDSGPSQRRFTVTAKDPLKLADGDRAKAPAISNGFLASAIDDSQTGATIAPTSAADDYPSEGKVAIGGTEVCAFTRSGTGLSLTRGASNTEAQAHDADERIQLVLEYDSESAADIIYDLFTAYTNIPATSIPLASWQEEIDQFIGRLYSAEIAQPTSVRKLVDELIEQVGLVMWSDVKANEIRLTALRPVSTEADVYDTDRILQGSYGARAQPKKRISQAWTFYGLLNPLEDLDEEKNYAFAAAAIDPDGTEADYDDQPAIHEVFSRWIIGTNRAAAERLNELLLARYSTPPREFEWHVWTTDDEPLLGRGYRVSHWELQTDEGAITDAPVQATSVEVRDDRYVVSAEEMLFGDVTGERVVFIDTDGYEINLRDLYDELYAAPGPYDTVTFVVGDGVQVGTDATTSGHYTLIRTALDVGDWPEGPSLRLINHGNIVGSGGSGRDARWGSTLTGLPPGDHSGGGSQGSNAIHTDYPITIENNGLIAGGGGGGGGFVDSENGSGGGGGAGARYRVGKPWGKGDPEDQYIDWTAGGGQPDWNHEPIETGGNGVRGGCGRLETGGEGWDSNAGDGGALGQAGEDSPISAGNGGTIGGAPGHAVIGVSLVTWDPEGDVRGPTDP